MAGQIPLLCPSSLGAAGMARGSAARSNTRELPQSRRKAVPHNGTWLMPKPWDWGNWGCLVGLPPLARQRLQIQCTGTS